jgi:hypothetical protein
MTTPTRPRQLTYMERTARFPLEFTIDVGSEIKQVKVPATWETHNLVRLGPYSTGKLVFSPRVNAHAAPVLAAFFKAIATAGVLGDILTYDGGFYPRLKRGLFPPPLGASKDVWGKQLSNHSRGTAVDLNAAENPMGHPGAAADKPGSLHRVIDIARSIRVEVETPAGHIWPAGIVCGADWKGASLDFMHFEVGTWSE